MSLTNSQALVSQHQLLSPGGREQPTETSQLGGGSIAKFCLRHLPGRFVTAVDTSAAVIALRQQFHIPPDGECFKVRCADGAAYEAHNRRRQDVIVIDAFNDEGVAQSLAPENFHRNVYTNLAEQGVSVMNRSGDISRYPLHIRALRRVFGRGVGFVPVAEADNLLLFGLKNPEQSLQQLVHNEPLAGQLQRDMGLPFVRYRQLLSIAYQGALTRTA